MRPPTEVGGPVESRLRRRLDERDAIMVDVERVSGIGGVFFRARDPEALARWYAEHLGVDETPPTYESDAWHQEAGTTVWAPFAADTEYFGRPEQTWMINFRVRDLDRMVTQLRAASIDVDVEPEFYRNGRFARLEDPEGNPIQLWEPWGRDAGMQVHPAIDLLFRHVERFNIGVRTGDFTPMTERFDERAEMVFEGAPVGPFEGREAIGRAYTEQPPDDAIVLLREPTFDRDTATVAYGWKAGAGDVAGEMRLTELDGRIRSLVITLS